MIGIYKEEMEISVAEKLVRRSLRSKGYDYSDSGAYFVTVCTDERVCYFGNIVDGIMISFPIIDVAREIWLDIPNIFPYVDLDAFIIMPNHIHGIVIIKKEHKNLHHKNPKDDKSLRRSLFNQAHIDCGNRKRNGFNHTSSVFMSRSSTEKKDWILTKHPGQTLGKIVRYFKAKSARIIHDNGFPRFDWQSNYFEHIVRSAKELNAIREYIINNPIRWTLDRENRLSRNFNMDLDKYFSEVFEK